MLHKYFFLSLLLRCRQLVAARAAGGVRGPRQPAGCVRRAGPAVAREARAVGGGACDARGRGGAWPAEHAGPAGHAGRRCRAAHGRSWEEREEGGGREREEAKV